MLKPISLLLHSFLLLVVIGTFTSMVYYIKNEPDVTAAPIIDTPMPVPTASRTSASMPAPGWSLVQPGLERRVIDLRDDQDQVVESVHIWRLDQNYFRLDVAFDGTPKTLEAWQEETDAALVVNGGYYSINDERYSADGLTVIDGNASGRSFAGFGGMLAIQDDRAELRWLVQEPYNAIETLEAALQAFPVLVEPGGRLGFGPERENHVAARRTVIAQDNDGRILFIVAPLGYFTLHQLSVYLTESDLDLDMAINLDGGGSTGILVADSRELIAPTRPLPFVILVYAR